MTEEEVLKKKVEVIEKFNKKNKAGLLDWDYFKSDGVELIVIQRDFKEPEAFLYKEEFIENFNIALNKVAPLIIASKDVIVNANGGDFQVDITRDKNGNRIIKNVRFILSLPDSPFIFE